MVAQRPPPKIVRSPPPSSSSSPPPPSTSAGPAQPMAKFPRFRREGTATTTTPNNNAASVNSTAPSAPRPGVGRTIPTTAGGRQPLRRRPSPSPPPNASAPTLEGSNQAPAAPATEAPSRSGFTLRRDGLGVPPQQQSQAAAQVARPGWKRRRPATAEGVATTASASAAASSGPQETPEAKRQQVERVQKLEPGTGVAAPKSAPKVAVAASVEASPPAPAVEEQRSNNASSAPAGDEGKASAPPPSMIPSPVLQDRVSDPSDLATPAPEESDPAVADPQVSKAAVAAGSDISGKALTVENAMNVAPVTEDGSGCNSGGDGEQVTDVDDGDAHDSAFVALIKKHAEMIRSSSLWISGALQSIRDDITKAAASAAGRTKLGEIVRVSVTDFFEPAAERTKSIGDATDAFAEEVERYKGEGKADKEIPS